MTLLIDDQEVGSRFVGDPEIHGAQNNASTGGNVVWEFNCMRDGHAFCFANRKGSDGDAEMTKADKSTVGKISVKFQAGESRPDWEMEQAFMQMQNSGGGRRGGGKSDFKGANVVRFDASSKDKFSTLRTVKGRMIKSRSNNGPGRPIPCKLQSDYVYGQVDILYDSAEHLEYRGILRPHHEPEHRFFFPDRDFTEPEAHQQEAPMISLVSDDEDMPRKRHKNEPSKGNDSWEPVY